MFSGDSDKATAYLSEQIALKVQRKRVRALETASWEGEFAAASELLSGKRYEQAAAAFGRAAAGQVHEDPPPPPEQPAGVDSLSKSLLFILQYTGGSCGTRRPAHSA